MIKDLGHRHAYAVDASILEILPQAICIPSNKQELIDAVRSTDLPLAARGGGTGITGGCLTEGLVLDLTRLNKILEINIEDEYVRVEPGVVQDTLNEALAPYGYRLGPDTSTGNRATIGGMIGNNASGAHALCWGTTADALLSVDLVLADGSEMTLSETPDPALAALLSEHNEAIDELPTFHKRSSGYLLNQTHQAKIIAGSEGTLGIVTEAKLKIVPIPQKTGLAILTFSSLEEALKKVASLLPLKPMAIELIDHKIIEMGRLSPSMRGKLDWLEGDPQALLIVEMEDPISVGGQVITDQRTINHVWALRKAGLGLLLSRRTYSRAVAFIEDLVVPPEKLVPFTSELKALLAAHGKEAGIYGHVGSGCLHVRPFVDIGEETDTMLAMLEEATSLVRAYGGALSAEHGDGKVRAAHAKHLFSDRVLAAFRAVKEHFDPTYKLGRGNILSDTFPTETLRKKPSQKPPEPVFDWSREGGFDLSIDLCNGNGACRKKDGLMCPSFHAEHDEYHTTRARAQSLRAALRGELPFDSKEIKDVLEWCIECKGCKTECPSQVDMAKMKAEFLHQYGKHSLRDRLFANVSTLSRIGSFLAPLSNLLPTPPGMARKPPPFARKRFSKSLEAVKGGTRQVVLFNDTFTEFYTPEVGRAAYQLLTHLDYEVIIPPYTCCGRPLISKGFLNRAKRQAARLVTTLLPYAERGIPIVGLEPSCLSSLEDDAVDLHPSAHIIAAHATSLEALLADQLQGLADDEVYLHVHCHQKALHGVEESLHLLPNAHLLKASCCGMAGSFGYEKEHYDFSKAIGERHLFPSVRQMPEGATLIASGTSCRHQIAHFCDKKPVHLAEFLADCIKKLS